MKTFIKVLLLLVFCFLSPLVVFLFSLKTSGFSGQSLKSKLANKQVYGMAMDEAFRLIEKGNGSNGGSNPLLIAEPFLKKEISPAYLQGKTEKLIDDTAAWTAGKTTAPPTLSFQDLKEKLVNDNRPLLNQLLEAAKQLKTQEQTAIQQAKSNNQNIANANLAMQNFDPEKLLKSNWIFPLDKFLLWLKSLYFYTHAGLFLLAGILFLILLAIVLLSTGIKTRLRWLGMTFLLAAGANLLAFLVANRLSKLTLSTIPPFAMTLTNDLLTPLLTHYLRFMKIGAEGFAAIAVICLLASLVFKDLV